MFIFLEGYIPTQHVVATGVYENVATTFCHVIFGHCWVGEMIMFG